MINDSICLTSWSKLIRAMINPKRKTLIAKRNVKKPGFKIPIAINLVHLGS